MLEAVILDNTERMLAGAGEPSSLSNVNRLIVGQSQYQCLGRNAHYAFPYSVLTTFARSGAGQYCFSWRSDVHDVLLLSNLNTYYVLAVNLTSGAMTLDSTGRFFDYITEDASGVIWANASNVGQYGLWKRTAAGAWTKVLADTAVGHLRRWIDGKVYYRSNAGNWYECTAGTAVVGADPSSVPGWHAYTHNRMVGNNDTVFNYAVCYSPGFLPGMGILPESVGYCGAEPTAARYWPFNAVMQTSGTKIAPIGNINFEMLAECTQPNIPNATTDLAGVSYLHQFFRLDNTYMLHVVAVNLNRTAATLDAYHGGRKLVLTILNKTTGVNKYIGSLYLTESSDYAVSATNAALLFGDVVGARMVSGVLDLWIAQDVYYNGNVVGLFKKSLTLNMDF